MTILMIILILGTAAAAGMLVLRRRPDEKLFPKGFSALHLTEVLLRRSLSADEEKLFGACLDDNEVTAVARRGLAGLNTMEGKEKIPHVQHCVLCGLRVRAAWTQTALGECPLKTVPSGRALEKDAFEGFPLLARAWREASRLQPYEQPTTFLNAAKAVLNHGKKTSRRKPAGA